MSYVQENTSRVIPKMVFIIPYRDREDQRKFYLRQMSVVLEDYPKEDYCIRFIHQNDKRGFNRGAMKNLGFIWVKNTFPDDYQNITIVFNDVDIMPLNKGLIDYETKPGIVKHFYGFDYALGGIVSFNALDFENINGFPNYWAWGYEDNYIQMQVLKTNLKIDRSQFYPIYDKRFILLHDTRIRSVNKTDFERYLRNVTEGIQSIKNISYEVDEKEHYVHINHFDTLFPENATTAFNHDLINGAAPFKQMKRQIIGKRRVAMPMILL